MQNFLELIYVNINCLALWINVVSRMFMILFLSQNSKLVYSFESLPLKPRQGMECVLDGACILHFFLDA